MDIKPDDPNMEVLFSQKVVSSQVAKHQKADVKATVSEDAETLLIVVYWDKTSKDIRGKFQMHASLCM